MLLFSAVDETIHPVVPARSRETFLENRNGAIWRHGCADATRAAGPPAETAHSRGWRPLLAAFGHLYVLRGEQLSEK